MDIWGGDPWADNGAKSPRIAKTDRPDLQSLPAAPLGSYPDEAGWGGFETSVENVWEVEQSSALRVALKAGNEEWKDTLPANSFTSLATDQAIEADHFENQDEEKEDETEDVVELPMQALYEPKSTAGSTNKLKHDTLDKESSNSASTLVADVQDQGGNDVSIPFASGTSELAKAKLKDKRHAERPISSSSETTGTPDSSNVQSARTSIDQGIPDSLQSEKHSNLSQEFRSTFIGEEAVTLDQDRISFEEQEASVDEKPVKNYAALSGPTFEVDVELVSKLFRQHAHPAREQESAPDLISSTSTRKYWYRITRPQTLRGFLKGDADDSYTRVAWLESAIRKDTIKVVSRWTSEDRINGRTVLGGSNKANFGWDQLPVKSVDVLPHLLSGDASDQFPQSPKPSTHIALSSLGATTSANSTAATTTAHFNWSSSPSRSPTDHRAMEHQWRTSLPSRPSSLHIADSLDLLYGHSSATEPPRQVLRLQSLSLLERSSKVDTSQVQEVALQSNNISRKLKPDLTEIDITSAHETQAPACGLGNDDNWGEMVQSPPPPDTPILPRSSGLPASGFTPVNRDLNIKKTQTISPMIPQAPKILIPAGPLSPARKAALNAARVTRTLSSHHESEVVPELESRMKYHTPSAENVSAPGPILNTTGSIPTHVSPQFEPVPGKNPEPTYDDWEVSLFETLQTKQMHGLGITDLAKSIPSLSNEESRRVQRLLVQLPDLSYMLR